MANWIIRTIFTLSMVAPIAICAPAGGYQSVITPSESQLSTAGSPVAVVSETAPSSQYHAQDELGQYSYGYTNADGQSKAEVKGIDGSIAGKYSYIDANGKKVEVSYVADDNGFRAVGDHLPSHDAYAHLSSSENDDEKKQVTKKDEAEGDEDEEQESKKSSSSDEEDDEEEEEEQEEESEQEKESEKKPKKQRQHPLYSIIATPAPQRVEVVQQPLQYASQPTVVQQQLQYASQPTTVFQVSNVPMTIQTATASGHSRPQLVYVARAVQLATTQPSVINQYAQTAVKSGHVSQPQVQQQLVNPYVIAAQPSVVSQQVKSLAPSLSTSSKLSSTATGYRLIQAAPIRSSKHSFQTYVPALHRQTTKQPAKQKSKSSSKKSQKSVAVNQVVPTTLQQQYSGHLVAASLPQMALLPGYGYINTQYAGF